VQGGVAAFGVDLLRQGRKRMRLLVLAFTA
jgi:hypothetical protein